MYQLLQVTVFSNFQTSPRLHGAYVTQPKASPGFVASLTLLVLQDEVPDGPASIRVHSCCWLIQDDGS